jgi:hypothetical protein
MRCKPKQSSHLVLTRVDKANGGYRRTKAARPKLTEGSCRCVLHVGGLVAEERQQLVDDGTRALTGRKLAEGLCRCDPHLGGLVAEERQQLVDDGTRALAGRKLAEGLCRCDLNVAVLVAEEL